jgi:hypothetical protein
MIAAGSIVWHAGLVFTVVEVRGDRVVLERAKGEGPTQIALLSAVELVVCPTRARSIYEGGAA